MNHGSQRGGYRRQGGGQGHQDHAIDLGGVRLKAVDGKPLEPDLFDGIAKRVAEVIAEDQYPPKPTQIRQFYDELVMWEERARQSPEKLPELLPFIRMMNAKAAYAQGRKHVTANFVAMISHCVKQVDDPQSLRHFKLFFEAFLGFYKLVGPKG